MTPEFLRDGRLHAVATSFFLFAVSLFFPAFHWGGDRAPLAGWSALVIGWVAALINLSWLARGEFSYWTCIAWFANPMLLGCWLSAVMHRRNCGLAFGGAALGLGLVFIATNKLPMGDQDFTDVAPGVGYALWIASILMALTGTALTARRKTSAAARIGDQRSFDSRPEK